MTWPELILLLITYAGFFYCGRVYEQVREKKRVVAKQEFTNMISTIERAPGVGMFGQKVEPMVSKPEPHQCQSDPDYKPLRPRRQSFSQAKRILEHDHAAEKSAETVAKNTEVLSPKVNVQ